MHVWLHNIIGKKPIIFFLFWHLIRYIPNIVLQSPAAAAWPPTRRRRQYARALALCQSYTCLIFFVKSRREKFREPGLFWRAFLEQDWYTCLIYSSNHGGKSSVRAVSRQNRLISENMSGHESYVFWRDSSKSTLSLVMWICSPFGERPILLSLLLSLFSW